MQTGLFLSWPPLSPLSEVVQLLVCPSSSRNVAGPPIAPVRNVPA
jgi:hypothetical protein